MPDIPREADLGDVKKRRKAAIRAVSSFLSALGWEKERPAKGLNPAFWKDPKGTGIHRIDFALSIEIARSLEPTKSPAKR
jgi:hypothetical protein